MKNDQERKWIIFASDVFSLVLNMSGVSRGDSGRALFEAGDPLQSGRTESTNTITQCEQQVKIKRVQARHICFTGRAGA